MFHAAMKLKACTGCGGCIRPLYAPVTLGQPEPSCTCGVAVPLSHCACREALRDLGNCETVESLIYLSVRI